MLLAILKRIGPSRLWLSTWTASRPEIEQLGRLKDEGELIDARYLIDVSFARRDPQAAVMERLKDAADIEAEVLFGWCLESCRDLYRRMVEIGDFAGALRAVKQLAELTRYVQNEPTPAAAASLIPVGADEPGGDG